MKRRAKSGQSRIGTSGWSYADWKGVFYPAELSEQDFLPFYAEQFDTVELNNTFYHLPQIQSVKHWAELVPADFVFSVKGSRFITHMKKLQVTSESIEKFFDILEPLKKHMGVVLFQLPGKWHLNLERFQQFIQQLPSQYRYAFEFRDTSWLVPEVYQGLTEANMACCIYDFAGFQAPAVLTADFVYLRFHGPQETPYVGAYSSRFLFKWAKQINQWLGSGLDVYCYFDNTADGAAIHNAQQLRQAIESNSKQHSVR